MRTRGLVLFVVTLAVLALPASALAAIKIDRIRYDPPGSDTGSNAHLNEEYIVITNTGNSRVNIGAWSIRDVAGHRYDFADGVRIRPGASIFVHTGSGDDTARRKYWDSGNYIWNNDGDTAVLRDDNGRRKDRCQYDGGGETANC